jgi:hypothetical protein
MEYAIFTITETRWGVVKEKEIGNSENFLKFKQKHLQDWAKNLISHGIQVEWLLNTKNAFGYHNDNGEQTFIVLAKRWKMSYMLKDDVNKSLQALGKDYNFIKFV